MEINRPATIDGNATFLTEDFQHHLKKFLNFYYEFYHVFTFLICNIFLVSKIVGLVGSGVVMAEISPVAWWVVYFVHGQIRSQATKFC